MISFIAKTLVVLAGTSFFVHCFLRAKSRRRKIKDKSLVSKKSDDLWNTVMFFPNYYPQLEEEDSTTSQLMWYLEQAKQSIDICIFCLNFQKLSDCLKRQALNGVKIRILTNGNISRARQMRNAGIQTRSKIHKWRNRLDPKIFSDLMHNKIVIIDDKAVMSGSLNWTWSGITENFENVIVSTNVLHVRKCRTVFERLWKESDRHPVETEQLEAC